MDVVVRGQRAAVVGRPGCTRSRSTAEEKGRRTTGARLLSCPRSHAGTGAHGPSAAHGQPVSPRDAEAEEPEGHQHQGPGFRHRAA